AAVRLERAAIVPDRDAGDLADDPVRDPGRDLPRDQPVLPLLPVPCHQVVPFPDALDQARDVAGVVLEVAVHADDDVAAGVVESGLHGGCLAVVAGEADQAHAGVLGGAARGDRGRGVGAAVVDEDQLPALDTGERLAHGGDEGLEGFFLVEERDDDGEGWSSFPRGGGEGNGCAGGAPARAAALGARFARGGGRTSCGGARRRVPGAGGRRRLGGRGGARVRGAGGRSAAGGAGGEGPCGWVEAPAGPGGGPARFDRRRDAAAPSGRRVAAASPPRGGAGASRGGGGGL